MKQINKINQMSMSLFYWCKNAARKQTKNTQTQNTHLNYQRLIDIRFYTHFDTETIAINILHHENFENVFGDRGVIVIPE